MKKAAVFSVFLAVILLISSCSKEISAPELANSVQKSYTDAGEVKLNALVTADYGERVYEFSLKYLGGEDGGTVEILSPENISGVKARVAPDGVTLLYDGAEIFTGSLTEEGLSPVEALPMMARLWKTGLITESFYEGGELICSFWITDSVTLKTSFDRETLFPVSAELIRDGYTVLRAEFLDVTVG